MSIKNYFRLIILLIPVLLFQGCALFSQLLDSAPKPTFAFQKIDITNITLTEITLNMLTSVKNPYPVSLPSSDLKMKLFIEDSPLSNIKTDLGKIEAKSVKDLPFEIKLKYSDLQELYKKFPNKELLNVRLDGIMGIPIPKDYQKLAGGKESIEFPFNENRNIPAVLPTIEIRNFKIIKPDPQKILQSVGNQENLANTATSFLNSILSGKKPSAGSIVAAGLSEVDINVDTEFDIALKNLAASKLNFSDLKYDLSLRGEKFLSGVPVDILNNDLESIVKVKTSFPLKSLSAGITDAITKRSADFKLNGSSGLKVPGIPDGLLNFQYDKKGNFTW